jgi:hypothetical protein
MIARMKRSSRKVAAWTALLAVVLNVLWPLIADGVSQTAFSSDRVEHAMQMEEGHCHIIPGGTPNNGHGSPHCAFCTLIGDKAPIVMLADVSHAGVLIVDSVPFPGSLAPPRQSPFYRSAPARAPPVLS